MLIYHHVPKSGGSYVIRALCASLRAAGGRPYRNYRIAFGAAEPDLETARASQGIVSSHWAFAPERMGKGSGMTPVHLLHEEDVWFTWTRDPAEMFISAFEFYRSPLSSTPWTRCTRLRRQITQMFQVRNFAEYVALCRDPDVDCFPLGQVLPGDARLEAFDFVGRNERMEADLQELCGLLGIEAVLPPGRENAGPGKVDRARWLPEVRELLEEKYLESGNFNH